ncbi:MAG: M16 family metallopeptidase [Phycisphaerae bacterium]
MNDTARSFAAMAAVAGALMIGRPSSLRADDVQPPSASAAGQVSGPPTGGKIVELSRDAELGITSAWLSNGVRVHHKYLTVTGDQIGYQKGQVWLSVTLAGGEIEENKSNFGITQAAGLVLSKPATSTMSRAEVRRLLGSARGGLETPVYDDVFCFEATTYADELEKWLEQIHLIVKDGRIEPATLRAWRDSNLRKLRSYQGMVQYPAVEAYYELVTGGDARLAEITAERLEALSPEEVQAWLDRLRTQAPIEVAVVGEISWDTLVPLVETYLGSLPKRPRTADHLKSLRRILRPGGPLLARQEVVSRSSGSVVIVGFVGFDAATPDFPILDTARIILDRRLAKRLRDERKLTTSIRVDKDMIWAYRDAGRLRALARCSRDNAEVLADTIKKEFQRFADAGPTRGELTAALKEMRSFYSKRINQQPIYWFRLLQHHDLHGRNIHESREMLKALKDVKPNDVRDVFRKYYTPRNRFQVIALAKSPEALKPGKKK